MQGLQLYSILEELNDEKLLLDLKIFFKSKIDYLICF